MRGCVRVVRLRRSLLGCRLDRDQAVTEGLGVHHLLHESELVEHPSRLLLNRTVIVLALHGSNAGDELLKRVTYVEAQLVRVGYEVGVGDVQERGSVLLL